MTQATADLENIRLIRGGRSSRRDQPDDVHLWLRSRVAAHRLCSVCRLSIVYNIYLSLTSWNGLSPKVPFVGFANYARLLHDPSFWNAFVNTVLWSVISLVINIVVPMTLAIILASGRIFVPTLFRSLLFCRVTMSLVAIGLMYSLILSPGSRRLRSGLRAMGLGASMCAPGSATTTSRSMYSSSSVAGPISRAADALPRRARIYRPRALRCRAPRRRHAQADRALRDRAGLKPWSWSSPCCRSSSRCELSTSYR